MPAGTEPAGRPARAAQRWLLALSLPALLTALAALAIAPAHVGVSAAGAHSVAIGPLGLSYPAVNAAAALLLVIAGLGAAIVAGAIRATALELVGSRRLRARLGGAAGLHGHPEVLVFEDRRPLAFCSGLVRPRAYLSTAAVAGLTPEQLRAVVAHEEHHRRARDPLRILGARLLARTLFFLPALAGLSARLSAEAELTADRAAVLACGGDPAPLAAAMLLMAPRVGPHAAPAIDPERVDSLLGRSRPWRPPWPAVWLTLAPSAAMVVLLWRAAGVAHAHATLAVPVLSAKPCVLVLALVPLAAAARRAAGRRSPTPERSLRAPAVERR